MKRDLPPYVYLRKGKPYFERRGYSSARIHAEPGTPEFYAEYNAVLRGKPPVPAGKSFHALIGSYKRSDRWTRLAPRTKTDYDKVLAFIDSKYGPLPVDRMQRKDVIRAQDANRETMRFANYIVQIFNVLMEHAIDIGWRDEGTNPAKGVRMLKSDSEGRNPWPDSLVTAYRAAAADRALLIFELCVGTGQRIGDVLRMRWSDIEGDGIKVKQGKTKAALWVPFTPKLRAAIAEAPKRGLTIVTKLDGGPLSYRSAADMVMAVRKEIGAEAYDIHSLRYTTASELGALGCEDDLIMAVTGHATAAMARKYAGPARQKARATKAQAMRK